MSATLEVPPPAPAGPISALGSLAAAGPPQDTDFADTAEGTVLEQVEDEKPNAAHERLLRRWIKSKNIADEDDEEVEEEILNEIAQAVLRDFRTDDESCSDYHTHYKKWLDFAMQIVEEKVYPWPRASNIVYPLLTVAAIQFAARAYPAIVRDRNVVKGSVVGDDKGTPTPDPATGAQLQIHGQPQWVSAPGEKKRRADLIGRHMSWQLLTEQEEWEPQTDRLLVVLPIVGTIFRKSYFDPTLRRNMSATVDALRLIVRYDAKSFETAPRTSELFDLYPWEIDEYIRGGIYRDEDYGHNQDEKVADDPDAPVTFIEQHRRWDLDGDGYAEPYIVTVAKDSGKLARIVACFDLKGIEWLADGRIRRVEKIEYYTKYGFIPSPASCVYDLGFGHLLYPINEAINTSLNQMFDAGHLQNVGGGFIGSGLSINTGAVRFQVGEYKPVNVIGGTLKDNIYPLPFPGPSQVLFALVQFLVESGKEIASVKDVMVGDLPGDNTSGITTLAVIEQGLKVYSAIYKRIHRSLGYEFRKLFRLNRLYLPAENGWMDGDVWRSVTRADYAAAAGVEPVSDPQMITDMQRLGRAQFLMQFKDDPMFNGRLIRLQMLDAAQIADAERLLVDQPAPDPKFTLKSRELDIRVAHEAMDAHIRLTKDKASMIRDYSQGVFYLAQARKLDNDAQLGWVEQHLEALRIAIDATAAGSDAGSDGTATGQQEPPAAPAGANAPPIPGLAAPPGNAAPPLPVPA